MAIGACCQGWLGLWCSDYRTPGPLLHFPNEIIPQAAKLLLLSGSLGASLTRKWAAALPYGLLMVQLPQQSSTPRAEENGCAEQMVPVLGQAAHCLSGKFPGA